VRRPFPLKFRAWDIKFKEMCPICSLDICGDEYGGVEGSRPSGGAAVLMDGEYKLMQYTGIKDRNGVEIYEGDILLSRPRSEDPRPRADKLRARCQVKFDIGFYLDKPVWGLLDGEHEIIGNIYENPELLELI